MDKISEAFGNFETLEDLEDYENFQSSLEWRSKTYSISSRLDNLWAETLGPVCWNTWFGEEDRQVFMAYPAE